MTDNPWSRGVEVVRPAPTGTPRGRRGGWWRRVKGCCPQRLPACFSVRPSVPTGPPAQRHRFVTPIVVVATHHLTPRPEMPPGSARLTARYPAP